MGGARGGSVGVRTKVIWGKGWPCKQLAGQVRIRSRSPWPHCRHEWKAVLMSCAGWPYGWVCRPCRPNKLHHHPGVADGRGVGGGAWWRRRHDNTQEDSGWSAYPAPLPLRGWHAGLGGGWDAAGVVAGEDGGGDSERVGGCGVGAAAPAGTWEEAQEAGYLWQGHVHVQLCMPSRPAALLLRYIGQLGKVE